MMNGGWGKEQTRALVSMHRGTRILGLVDPTRSMRLRRSKNSPTALWELKTRIPWPAAVVCTGESALEGENQLWQDADEGMRLQISN